MKVANVLFVFMGMLAIILTLMILNLEDFLDAFQDGMSR